MKKVTLLIPAVALALLITGFSGLDKNTIAGDFELAEQQYSKLLAVSTDLTKYPRSADGSGRPSYTNIKDWTGGFWPGCLWNVYEYTKKDKWKAEAIKWTESLEKNQYNTAHHDIGFMMYTSYGNAYRITKNPAYKNILVQSAKSLLTRFNPKVKAIKSWEIFHSWDGQHTYHYPVIIDNMMNLELLFFASKATGDSTYRNIAVTHAETTLQHHYRPDFSSYHVVNYDPKTGEVLSKETAQGFSDNSAWARGQAWGLYGYTMTYRETGNKKFLDAALRMADFYMKHSNLPEDHIPYWDFNAGEPGYQPKWYYQPAKFKEIPRDVSAAAITSSALLELSTYASGKNQKKLFEMAVSILSSLSTDVYRAKPGTNGFQVLKHSVGSIPHNGEIDVPLIYADYYFLEALLRYQRLVNKEPVVLQ
ncbi:glycoside hydrolase family 88 protein [Filimonas effusa]|uniref:Glucuronyl hydrolase n=1 Tax=Filimonas effusa TaxID=2508721 RepID=A0A4Q1DB00_9BACT|nr:glycoside hydrolase family 88 protein [Filimonas effusa]RXK86602.1 glucuronyl hydrolase [Filimonas effusa]